jgi:hypothetical protein
MKTFIVTEVTENDFTTSTKIIDVYSTRAKAQSARRFHFDFTIKQYGITAREYFNLRTQWKIEVHTVDPVSPLETVDALHFSMEPEEYYDPLGSNKGIELHSKCRFASRKIYEQEETLANECDDGRVHFIVEATSSVLDNLCRDLDYCLMELLHKIAELPLRERVFTSKFASEMFKPLVVPVAIWKGEAFMVNNVDTALDYSHALSFNNKKDADYFVENFKGQHDFREAMPLDKDVEFIVYQHTPNGVFEDKMFKPASWTPCY